ncbi:MAG: serine/threonine-protein phosphatase [Mycoplasma sp.]|nr:serine/threonine-protein phosphatase [Candidatus Hennigella equi]
MTKKRIKFAIKSLKGKRPINQDSLACSFNKENDFCGIVCDGVGSVAGSEHASKIVANTFADEFSKTGHIESVTTWFKETLKKAMDALLAFANDNKKPDIATTLALLIIIDKKFYVYNIGDTRVYAFRKHDLTHEVKQYSYDHNYKNFLIANDATPEQLEANKSKWHALTNYIDASNPRVAKFDVNSGSIDQRTYFLICTDGLYGYVRDNTKYDIATRIFCPIPYKMTLLNKNALDNGSDDNVSGILVSVK